MVKGREMVKATINTLHIGYYIYGKIQCFLVVELRAKYVLDVLPKKVDA